jgi:hypothetical protein
MARGQEQAAEMVYTRALSLSPGNPALLANRALARQRLGKPWEAVQDARQCVAVSPQWSKGHARLGSGAWAQYGHAGQFLDNTQSKNHLLCALPHPFSLRSVCFIKSVYCI